MNTILRRARRHLTYANVIATIALLLAVSGTAWAAARITGVQVVDGSLTGADVRNSSLTGIDVRDRSLTARDFRAGSLPRGARGPAGATGATGPTGPTGATGSPGEPTYLSTVVIQATGDDAANGTRLRDGLARAGTIAAAADHVDEQVVVQLEPGDYQVASELVVPLGVSVVGPVIRAANITVASGPFPDAAVMRLAGNGSDGDRYLAHFGIAVFGATTVPSTFTVLDLGGNDVEAVELDVAVANATATTAVRGIAQTGDGGRFQLAGGRLFVSAPNPASAQAVVDASSSGMSLLLDGVQLIAGGSGAASAALITNANTFAELNTAHLSGEGAARGIDGGGIVRAYASSIESAASHGLRATGDGTQFTLFSGVLTGTPTAAELSNGQVTCVGVTAGFADISASLQKLTCAPPP